MPPMYFPRPASGKPGPLVLPRYFASVVDLEGDGWPQFLLLTRGFGLLDPAAGFWHGLDAANDE